MNDGDTLFALATGAGGRPGDLTLIGTLAAEVTARAVISAIHHAGLVSLTHTPSPMGFLNEILHRPANERPFLLLVVGFPAEGATVPDIAKKPLEEIATFV